MAALGFSPIEDSERIESELYRQAIQIPGKCALVDGVRRVNFAEFAAAAASTARQLIRAGVRPGDRVAVYLDKCVEAVFAFYGIWSAGAVVVPVHHSLKSAQVQRILRDSGSVLIVSERARLSALDPGALGATAPFELHSSIEVPTADRLPEGLSGKQASALILYTSGSTGQPKGILLSHGNLVAGTRIVAEALGLTAADRILSVLPFSFDYGLNQLLTTVRAAATLVLQRSSHPADICRTLQEERITGLAGVPLLWAQLMQRQSPFASLAFPSLRYITNSGGAFPLGLLARYRRVFPAVSVFLMYGLSEAFRSTILPPEEVDRFPDSMGKAIAETELLVIDEAGQPCAAGETGQLVHVGPTVAMGYWNDPQRTDLVFRPHPFDPRSSQRAVYSGDLVRRDTGGRLFFIGRNDQMMKIHGFRVSPDEVEEIVHSSGMVAEVVARAEPDDSVGTQLVIDVVPSRAGEFDIKPLVAYFRRKMPRYMIPRQVYVHECLPRTPSGKIDRAGLSAR
jgi:amino acid adenylation domain-containing protein